jgi:photosystem II stability/assembly factor-like uncharacterized protein
MKTILTRTRWILVLSPILAVALLICCYNAIGKARRTGSAPTAVSPAASIPDRASPSDDDNDPEYLEARQKFLNRFFGSGPGKVSPTGYAKALATVRALPLSPLLRSRTSTSSEGPTSSWTFPILSPIANDWGGGASSRTDAIAVDPTKEDIVYEGSEGGLVKSSDGGQSWNYVSDDLPSQSIRCIAVDPQSPNIVYAGTGTQPYFGVGVFRSDDAGQSWRVLGSSVFNASTVGKIVIDPATAGSSESTTVYASVTSGPAQSVWKSEDSGSHWTMIRGPTYGAQGSYDIVIASDPRPTIYITAPDGVYKKDISSEGWEMMLDDQYSGGPAHLAVAMNEHEESVLYLAYQEPDYVTVISTSDQGANWNRHGRTAGGMYCFGVDPVHANRLFVGGGGDLRYSMDGGDNWLNSGGVHVDIHAIAFCPSNSKRNYLGTDGGIYRADYDGTDPDPISWSDKNEHLPAILMQGVSLSSDGNMIMGAQDNGNQFHNADNPPWRMIRGGDGFKPLIHPDDGEIFYFVDLPYGRPISGDHPDPGRVIHGQFEDVTPRDAYGESSNIFPAIDVLFGEVGQTDTDHVVVGFQNVWRSEKSGATGTWTRIGGSACINPPTNSCGIDPGWVVQIVAQAPTDASVIYAITRGDRVLVTSNANDPQPEWRNITRSNLPGGIAALKVDPTDPQTVYLVCASDIYKTTDMGGSWSNLTGGLAGGLAYGDLAIDPTYPNRVIAASHVGVIITVNGGLTWENMSEGLPAGLTVASLSFNAISRQLAAGTYGRGVYLIDIPFTAVSIISPLGGTLVSQKVKVAAVASNDVIGVQFLLDDGLLDSEDMSVPFSVDWDTTSASVGHHTLSAVARDAGHVTTTSAPVTVLIDRAAPTVAITAPANGTSVSNTVTITATASDDVGVVGVQFYIDGAPFTHEVTSVPYSRNWDTTSFPNGTHTLTAVARDEANHTTMSLGVRVSVHN